MVEVKVLEKKKQSKVIGEKLEPMGGGEKSSEGDTLTDKRVDR